jgi:threonyl-tRNA synthetase
MADERKTLEQRAQVTDIERLRHSAAHVVATAILKLWPDAQFAADPPIENGFLLRLYSHRKAAAGSIFAAPYAGATVARRATTRNESSTTP